MNSVKKSAPLIGFILLAFWLKTAVLTNLPPGLTHDEANHGREALGILDGVFLFYFPLNYGSEPFYSYTVSGLMALIGESLFALRLVNVFFGTAVLAITYTWATKTFNRTVALLTVGLMALSFWPLASSRQALRAGMLPFFFGLAIYYFWQMYHANKIQRVSPQQRQHLASKTRPVWWIVGFGVCIALTLHIYLASRVSWLLFPLFIGYLFLVEREQFRKLWRPTALGLLLAGVLVLPMFLYVRQNPYVLTRLDMLDSPLQQLAVGNFRPVLENIASALLAFGWPGQGDQFLAYNVPGRPVLDGITAVFFIIGLLACLWQWKRPSYAFVLLWFGVGIVPSLLTGATANTTRNLAALAVVHLLPALGFYHLILWLKRIKMIESRRLETAVMSLWLFAVGWSTTSAYFVQWGQSPDVRGAYQRNLVESLAYLDQQDSTDTVLISTVYPGPVHDPSINLVLTAQNPRHERWADARYALLFPQRDGIEVIVPQSTAAHPVFTHWLTPIETVPLRPSDLDPSFTAYRLDPTATEAYLGKQTAVNFNNAITLHYAGWLNETVAPSGVAELLTIWQVGDPTQIGPTVPPTFTTDVAMFAQILSADGIPLAQRDALDAPSWNWQSGDTLIQIQPIAVPQTAVSGEYSAIVGFYDKLSGDRTPVLNEAGETVGDYTAVAPLLVQE